MDQIRRQHSSIFRLVSVLLVWLLGCGTTLAGNSTVLGAGIQRELKAKYPGMKLVKGRGGRTLGRAGDDVAVLHDPENSKFLVVWVRAHNSIQELDSVAANSPDDFELQCMNAREASERQSVLRRSEAIINSLKVPAGRGAVCYFIDETTAKCWSVDHATGRMKEVGGWQT